MTDVFVDHRGVVVAGTNLPIDFWDRMQPRQYRKIASVLAGQTQERGVVVTPEGEMAFEPGDYIVTDCPPTHAWPVKREVFERTYETIQ